MWTVPLTVTLPLSVLRIQRPLWSGLMITDRQVCAAAQTSSPTLMRCVMRQSSVGPQAMACCWGRALRCWDLSQSARAARCAVTSSQAFSAAWPILHRCWQRPCVKGGINGGSERASLHALLSSWSGAHPNTSIRL